MLRAWTTTLFLASTLLFACGGDDDGGSGDGDGDGSGSVDAAPGGGGDGGGGTVDGAPGSADASPTFEGIPCADDTCTAGTEVCCAGEGGLTCETECATMSFGCDGPEDCTTEGEVCCGSGADGTQCAAAGDCGETVEGDVVCHVADDCPEAGQECCMQDNAMVGVCRMNCGGPPA
jgi:hypothetical protein